jgi:conjugative transfer signal peptidase TraF
VHVGEYVCLPPLSETSPASLHAAFRDGILPQEWRDRPFLKRVAAVEGDVISYDGGVRVNGRLLPASQAADHDRHGRALPHPAYPRRLARGEVWLTSEHPRGFDSRYFGPVKRDALTCVGGPLWTI